MSESESRAHQAPRRVFIDVLRLIAAVQMIQGHSVDAALASAHRQGGYYQMWSFARGLTSVTFLVTAGLALVLAQARGDVAAVGSLRERSAAGRRRRARRALTLVAIGYLMHLPFGILVGVPRAEALRAALVVDVLQCIGVSLLGLELLSLRVQSVRARVAISLGLAAACFAAAPVTRGLSVTGPLRVLGNYVSTADGSLFPLIPWAGYVLAGFGLGNIALRRADGGVRVLAAAALASAALAALGTWLGPALPAAVSPSYCLLKLACVLALASVLMVLLARVRRLPSLLARLASETLFLYVSHVVILYADGIGVAHHLGDGFGPAVGVLLALGLLLLCGAGALVADRVLRTLRRAARGGTRGATP